jgi:hypothetical protein
MQEQNSLAPEVALDLESEGVNANRNSIGSKAKSSGFAPTRIDAKWSRCDGDRGRDSRGTASRRFSCVGERRQAVAL